LSADPKVGDQVSPTRELNYSTAGIFTSDAMGIITEIKSNFNGPDTIFLRFELVPGIFREIRVGSNFFELYRILT
jgi:hypothetical protein